MKHSRRKFIKTTGCVTIGFSFLSTAILCGKDVENKPILAVEPIDSWLKVAADGRITVLTGRMELGQGVRTAMRQVAAEELNMALEMVEVNLAETGVTPNEGYTAGSRSMEQGAMSVRYAAAAAREVFLNLAAQNWKVDAADLFIEEGKVKGNGQQMTFAELLDGRQINDEVSKPKLIYGKTRRRWVGQAVKRPDILKMVQGKPVYVQDLNFPEMVHARIVRPAGYRATLKSFDSEKLKRMPGFIKVAVLGNLIGVLAQGEFEAIKLAERATELATWDIPKALPASTPMRAYIQGLNAKISIEEDLGDTNISFANAQTVHESEYFKPYLMHAANGPSCAVARYQDGQLDIWSHTQGVYPLRATLANLLKMDENDIHVKGVPGSGCYGHNGADDVAAEAALLAKEIPGKHVRLQWMRADEHGWEPYGSAMLMKLKAGLDGQGSIQGWEYDFWSDTHATRPNGNPASLLPASYLKRGFDEKVSGYTGGAVRNSKPYYEFSGLKTTFHNFTGPLRVSALRGLGAYANIFAIECFMDELAEKAGIDPIVFRTNHLKDGRALACLKKLKALTSEVKVDKGQGIGYAFSRYKNQASYCAVAALVDFDASAKKLSIIKMWAVVDAGECINLDGLKNQIEGGMLQSASWALMEEVRFDQNHITSLDWDSYPILRFPESFQTEVEVIDRPEEAPLGAGEAAQGPATAALCNALYSSSGIRIKELPLNSALRNLA